MHCQRCGYLLFNLPRPQCPECGEPFDTNRYRFEIGSVSFHCPQCDQAYYGNDDRGLPWPREFECVQCHRPITLQQMRVVPQTPEARGRAGSPWDDRRELGFWRAWWSTTRTLLLRPSAFYRSHVGTSTSEAFVYAITSSYVGILPLMLMQSVIMGMMMGVAAGTGGAGPMGPAAMPPWWLFPIVFGIVGVVAPLLAPLLNGGIWTLTTHLGVWLLAPNRKSIEHTFRAVLYSFGVTSILAIPICGAYAAGIWQIVTIVIGVREIHSTTTGRAAVAVLWPLFVGIPLYVGLVLFILYMAGQ